LESTNPVPLVFDGPATSTVAREKVRLPLISTYLEEQQRLSAVERFSLRHDAAEAPAQARYYEDLIPSGKPGSGQQYAFSVDLDKCTGCKACVTACKSLNGLDEGETWRAVGTLHGGTAAEPYQQSVTAACHHCVDPGCMKGCPVGAYEKDPVTGIVRHLDDQCIGCQYCMLTCPYEVPQYSERLGIVRKCDLCSDRLSAGEAPACVQACPNEAIAVRIVEKADIVASAEAGVFLPTTPSPAITLPSTEYKTKRGLPKNAVAVDFERIRPAAQHAPLAIMLVLTQLSIGAFSVDFWLGHSLPEVFEPLRPYHSLLSLGAGFLALGASLLHLGRPQYGFRAILGIRTSWLSREIAAVSAFAGLATLYAASLWQARIAAVVGLRPLSLSSAATLEHTLGGAVALVGAGVVVCSAMVYRATGRTYWRGPSTTTRFFLSAAVQGLATTLLISIAADGSGGISTGAISTLVAAALAIATTLKLAQEASIFTHLRDRLHVDLRRTARLLISELGQWTSIRFGVGVMGGILLPLAVRAEALAGHSGGASVVFALLSFLLVLMGELTERALFFMSVSAPRMPGGIGR
jgi:formate dehydrogenase iron-sulfur subunit